MSIIIVGGGMSGAVLALAISNLSQGLLPISIIEEKEPEQDHHPGYDTRTIVLSDGTCRELKKINLWSLFKDFATPIHYIHISENKNFGFLLLRSKDYGIDAFGQVIQLKKIGQYLFTLLQKEKNISLYCPASVIEVYREKKKVMVILHNKKKVYGKLLIAANGPCSHLAQKCGIRWKKKDYNQIAITGNIMTQFSNHYYAFERFTYNGPLAILPVTKHLCSFVCCVPTKMKSQILNWNNNDFLKYLQHFFGWKLGKFIKIEKSEMYPLTLETAVNVINHRIVVIGNTAQKLHPVAGQGYNIGVRDIILLSKILVEAYNSKKDFGNASILEMYQESRLLDRKSIIFITDTLVKMFSNNNVPLRLGRNLGFFFLNLCPSIRNIFIQYMLGWIKY